VFLSHWADSYIQQVAKSQSLVARTIRDGGTFGSEGKEEPSVQGKPKKQPPESMVALWPCPHLHDAAETSLGMQF
jgi:hypothetical protein